MAPSVHHLQRRLRRDAQPAQRGRADARSDPGQALRADLRIGRRLGLLPRLQGVRDALARHGSGSGVRRRVRQRALPKLASTRPVVDELLTKGHDPLDIVIGFCRRHGMERFAAVRLNYIHDGYGFDFKIPDWTSRIRSSWPARPRARRRSATGRRRLRTAASPQQWFRMIAETCRRFDLHGIELDLTRHPLFFCRAVLGRGGHRCGERLPRWSGACAVMLDAAEHERGVPSCCRARHRSVALQPSLGAGPAELAGRGAHRHPGRGPPRRRLADPVGSRIRRWAATVPAHLVRPSYHASNSSRFVRQRCADLVLGVDPANVALSGR